MMKASYGSEKSHSWFAIVPWVCIGNINAKIKFTVRIRAGPADRKSWKDKIICIINSMYSRKSNLIWLSYYDHETFWVYSRFCTLKYLEPIEYHVNYFL